MENKRHVKLWKVNRELTFYICQYLNFMLERHALKYNLITHGNNNSGVRVRPPTLDIQKNIHFISYKAHKFYFVLMKILS